MCILKVSIFREHRFTREGKYFTFMEQIRKIVYSLEPDAFKETGVIPELDFENLFLPKTNFFNFIYFTNNSEFTFIPIDQMSICFNSGKNCGPVQMFRRKIKKQIPDSNNSHFTKGLSSFRS